MANEEKNCFVEAIESLPTLQDTDTFARNLLESGVAKLCKSSTRAERKRCSDAIRALKHRLNPLQTSDEAQTLLQRHAPATSDDDRQLLQTQYVKLGQNLLASDQGVLYTRVTGRLEKSLAPLLALDYGTGYSNRARRAKAANAVFTRNAGLSSGSATENGGEEGGVDRYGNMIGTDWDLGRDGAYDGLGVLILQLYAGEGFTGKLPVAALQEKGFQVHHKVIGGKSDLPSTDDLDALLDSSSQVWVISGSYEILRDEDLEVIVKHWQNGLGVYIFGDNCPFYVDANRLLAKMTHHFNFSDSDHSGSSEPLSLSGNTSGGEIVRARNASTDTGAGFVPGHLLTTGLVALYEGVTVSTLRKETALKYEFEEVLREHTGELVVVARQALRGVGPVIVDGAFTKLFCHWQLGGSSRFVRNCACWLSAILDDEVAADTAEDNQAKKRKENPSELELEKAYIAECSISANNGPIALLASALADEEQNTTDFSLDNNLALARDNMILGSQPLHLDVAKMFLQQGINPFTRLPVVAVVPVVSLSNKNNLELLAEVANQLFMGGRGMSRHSLNILLSVCEEMLHRQPDCPDAIQFLIREILLNAVSTPDMLKGIPGGPTVPLEQGLRANITITGEFVPLRKAFAHVTRIVRLLAVHASESQRPSTGVLCQIARRSLLKTLIGAAGRVAKLDEGSPGQAQGSTLKLELDKLMFERELGIPIGGTAKLVELQQLKMIVEKGNQHTNIDDIIEDVDRTAASLNLPARFIGPSDITIVLTLLRGQTETLWQVLIEPLLRELKLHPTFGEVWDGEGPKEESQRGTATEFANAQLTGKFASEPEEHAKVPWPGFATPFGPSVYRCKCGLAFGDPRDDLDERALQNLKDARNKHFQDMFGADGNGYPTDRSVHFPLHRAVQRVLTTEAFKTRLQRTSVMEAEVASYLQRKKRGNIHVKSIRQDICFAIDTYLDCRRNGMAEPKPDEPVEFRKKAELEQKLILRSRRLGQGSWIDPPRSRWAEGFK